MAGFRVEFSTYYHGGLDGEVTFDSLEELNAFDWEAYLLENFPDQVSAPVDLSKFDANIFDGNMFNNTQGWYGTKGDVSTTLGDLSVNEVRNRPTGSGYDMTAAGYVTPDLAVDGADQVQDHAQQPAEEGYTVFVQGANQADVIEVRFDSLDDLNNADWEQILKDNGIDNPGDLSQYTAAFHDDTSPNSQPDIITDLGSLSVNRINEVPFDLDDNPDTVEYSMTMAAYAYIDSDLAEDIRDRLSTLEYKSDFTP